MNFCVIEEATKIEWFTKCVVKRLNFSSVCFLFVRSILRTTEVFIFVPWEVSTGKMKMKMKWMFQKLSHRKQSYWQSISQSMSKICATFLFETYSDLTHCPVSNVQFAMFTTQCAIFHSTMMEKKIADSAVGYWCTHKRVLSSIFFSSSRASDNNLKNGKSMQNA